MNDQVMIGVTCKVRSEALCESCSSGVSLGYVPLAHAVMAEKLDSVKLLLKMGASVNRQDNLGRTCLAMAAYQVRLTSAD